MINAKLTKQVKQETTEERLFKLLESMDWKLWEMMNMMKDNLPEKTKSPKPLKTVIKQSEE
jgi:hypothetical protein